MLYKQWLYRIVWFVLLSSFTKVYSQQSVSECTPITPENGNNLTLFMETEGFSEISLADVFSNMNVALDTMAWSPDSLELSVAGATFSIDATNDSFTYYPQAHPMINVYRSDGIPLSFRGDSGELEIWQAESGERLHRLQAGNDYIRDPTLSPDGRFLAFGDGDSQIQLWDLTTGIRLHMLEGDGLPSQTLAFSPDGTLLVSGSYATSPRLWDISTGTLLYDLGEIGIDNHVWDVEFSPDGTLLAVSTHGSVALVNLEDLPGEPVTYLHDNVAASEVFSIAFHPDEMLLAIISSFQGNTDSYTVEIWDIENTMLVSTWRFDAPLDDASFSPDGCFLAIIGNGGTHLKMWHVD